MAELTGKVAVVTGSTSGIGLGIAHGFARAGADIVLNGFGDGAAIEKLRAETEAMGVRAIYVAADLSIPADGHTLIQKATAALGAVDILVNNAGIQHVDEIVDFPAAQWDRIIAINLSSAFHTMQAAIPGMKAKGWGRIINIASAHGLVGSPGKSAYVAAKHGLLGLTKVAAIETANNGITVNAICPGWVLTPLVEAQLKARAEKDGITLDVAKAEFLREKQPMAKFSTPENIAAAALYLCSNGADTTTGIPLSVDGGWVIE
jgi:3-hydroxybutyrate dehydrogenase